MAGFRDRGTAALAQRVIPHPSVMLAVEFGAGVPVVTDAAGRQRRGSVIAGPGQGGTAWVRGADVECLQIRLSPLVVRAVLGVPPAELAGFAALEDVWGDGRVARLREQLSEAGSWERRFALAGELLDRAYRERTYRERAYGEGALTDPEVARAWHRIVAGRGAVRVEDLAAEVGWSRRRLWSRFGEQTGLSPKRAARLVRFDRAAHRLAAGHAPARVAAEAGYADQSHLHRDVRAFAGVTPGGVAREPWLAVDEVAWPGTRTEH
jgi:AraC-like DNA-binding protein